MPRKLGSIDTSYSEQQYVVSQSELERMRATRDERDAFDEMVDAARITTQTTIDVEELAALRGRVVKYEGALRKCAVENDCGHCLAVLEEGE